MALCCNFENFKHGISISQLYIQNGSTYQLIFFQFPHRNRPLCSMLSRENDALDEVGASFDEHRDRVAATEADGRDATNCYAVGTRFGGSERVDHRCETARSGRA